MVMITSACIFAFTSTSL